MHISNNGIAIALQIYCKCIKNNHTSELFLDSTRGKFKNAIDRWFKDLGNGSIKDFETCLIIDL